MEVAEKRLKKETEGMIMAPQDQALRTMSIKRIIDKQNVSAKRRMCGEGDETVSHILYRNAGNLLKSNIDVGGKTRWSR